MEITIKDLMDVIHYTIIKYDGENYKFIDEVRKFAYLIEQGEIENHDVSKTELWESIMRNLPKKPTIPHTNY
jgi:hypothetical protein